MPNIALTCPHCGGHFDYEYVPGVSVSAVRLATKRYMKCPLCQRWGTFNLRAGDAPTGALRLESLPAYSDKRLFERRGAWIIAPIAIVLISLIWAGTYPTLVLWVDIAMLVLIVLAMVVLLLTSRLPRTN